MSDLIEYLRGVAENANLPQYMRDRLTEAAAALEAAREDATSTATSPAQILIDAIEQEIRQLEGTANWRSQTARIASLRAAIDQARSAGAWR